MGHQNLRPKIPHELRDKGVYIAGKPGYGKTNLILWHIRQDFLLGNGVCFVDPNGDAVDELLHWIPENRLKDVVLFDTRYPRAIDFLSCDEGEQDDMLNDLANLFNLEGAQKSKPLVIQLIATLLEAKNTAPELNISFMDVGKFIREPQRQKDILAAVPHRKSLYTSFKLSDYETVLTRMIPIQENKTLLAIFSGKDPLNIYDLIQEKKIFLVRLRVSSNDHFIGSLIITKIQQMAMRRSKHQRVPYYLYVDEFENVQTAPFSTILKQGRKFKLCLTLANQIVGVLDDSLRRTILGTLSTFIILHIHDDDCRYFKSIVPPDEDGRKDPSFLAELPQFRALYKIGDAPSFLYDTPEPPRKPTQAQVRIAQDIIKRTKALSPCNALQDSFNEGDDYPTTSELKSDEISPDTKEPV
jgi:hypothetical protein